MNNVSINAAELRTWIKTNFVSQVAPKSFAGNMVQSIIEKIDEMEEKAKSMALTPYRYETVDEDPVETRTEVVENAAQMPENEPKTPSEDEIKREAQQFIRHRRRR